MPNDISARSDFSRFADDGDPPTSYEALAFDPPEPWTPIEEDPSEPHFALAFDSGGEG